MEDMGTEGWGRLGVGLRNIRGPLGWWEPGFPESSRDRPGWQRGKRGGNRSIDRLMAPALHTIEFAFLSLPALGKGLSSWELSWTSRVTGYGSARPDSLRRNEVLSVVGSLVPRGAGGSGQKDKAREGPRGGRRFILALPSSWEPPILKTQLTVIYNMHHHPFLLSHLYFFLAASLFNTK